MEVHNVDPIYDGSSKILILGSFPSVKSREARFFYSHPQNRFWKVMSNVFEYPLPTTIEDKKNLLHENHISLWDTIKSCDVIGSSDSTIKNVIPNDIPSIVAQTQIVRIYTNGNTAHKMYQKYIAHLLDVPEMVLPSTSPANAKYTLNALIESWKVITDGIVITSIE